MSFVNFIVSLLVHDFHDELAVDIPDISDGRCWGVIGVPRSRGDVDFGSLFVQRVELVAEIWFGLRLLKEVWSGKTGLGVAFWSQLFEILRRGRNCEAFYIEESPDSFSALAFDAVVV